MTSAPMEAVHRLAAAFNQPDPSGLLHTIDDLFVPQVVLHGDAAMRFSYGRDAFRDRVADGKVAFPDAAVEILQLFAEGAKAMVHLRISATHRQEWLGVAATGRRLTWTATAILRFNDGGKVAEVWLIQDRLGLLQQLGRIERLPGQGG